jgi:peptidyl-prolyl cis-trans isomerase B (cyclophilin B)
MSQITPVKTYNGVDRPLLVKVEAADDAKLQLLEAGTAKMLMQVDAKAGQNDLAELLMLWKSKLPNVTYVQLVVSGQKVGPALVLQPMLNPTLSKLAADGKTVEFVADEDGPMYNGIRAYVDQDLVVETSMGDMRFRLRPDAAPNTAWNIMKLAEGGFYSDTIFHRVVAKRPDGSPFVIQGGDPTGTGSGGPGFAYALEKSTLPHDFGVISIARSTDPNTNGSQFFVCLSREGTKHLDGRYAAFGQMVSGAETLRQIAQVPVGEAGRPKDPPKIKRVYLVPASPYTQA